MKILNLKNRPNLEDRCTAHPPGGGVSPLLIFKDGMPNNGERANPERADNSAIKGITMKNIPDTETMSRLSLSEKGWNGSGFPEMGLTRSTLEYLASNCGLSSSWSQKHIPA